MPLLAAEPDLYPPDLFQQGSQSFSHEEHWWVLHCRPRQEKALARQLREHRVPFYLPIIARRLRIRNRNLTSHVPLFPGYLFMLANREQRTAALTTNRVVHTLQVGDQGKLWSDLCQVQHLIATGAPITPEDRLAPGSAVEIKCGPLAGLKGKILRNATGRRFVVEVDFIQRGASVMLEDHYLIADNDG
jgi:transcriptional antiterminator RfaH